MAKGSLEEGLTVVENELSQLKKQVVRDKSEAAQAPWWQQWFGAFKDDPDFDAAMEKGVAYRRSQPTAEQSGDMINIPAL